MTCRPLPGDWHDRVHTGKERHNPFNRGENQPSSRNLHESIFCADIGAMAIIAVNISSIKENVDYDKTCVLHVGDHPFIKHDSYVRYKDATAMKVENILEKISHREITVLENLSDEVFERVFAGFEKSEYTSRKIKKQLRVAATARKAL